MKTIINKIVLIIVIIGVTSTIKAQRFVLDNETSFTQVLGTSSLHDWHVQAEKQSGNVVFSDFKNNQISSLHFNVESESLKSGKSAMDKKTFTALKTESFKTINFELTKVNSVSQKSEENYLLNITGTLTIAGVKKSITIPLEMVKKDNIIMFIGSYKLLMTSYNIEPPKALLGTIKTGDEVEIKFKSVFTN